MALTEMLADPQTRRLVGTLFPIEGGACVAPAREVMPGTFGADCPAPRDFSFDGKVGIGTPTPGTKLEVRETGINVVAAKLAGLGTPPDYSRNVALSFHPRVDFLVNDGARIEAQLTSGVSGSEYADLALQTRAAGVLSTTMLLQAGGNVGIGTPTPGARLDVAGGGVRSQGPAGGNHAFLGSFANGTFTNWLNTGDNATFYNLLGGPNEHSGFGVADGNNIVSPIVWMYAAGGRNMLDVRSVGYLVNPTAGTSLFTVRESGNVGIGTTTPQSKLNVKGSASFTASGTVAVTGTPAIPTRTVTGTGTSFTAQVKIGDRITFTAGGKTLTRTVNVIGNDTSLTVDADIHVTGSPLTMTVLPSIFRGDKASGTPPFTQFTACGDGSARFPGFLGLAGTRIHNDDDVGYVVCFFDNEGNPFLNTNNEMRGYNATMRYTRTTADANKPPNGDGWDVIPHLGAVSLENMNLPPTDTQIRGQMKPFQSELRFEAATGPSPTPHYEVVKPAQNYVGALFKVHTSCTIKQWAAFVVGVPCPEGGAASKVTTGYGVWVKDLDDPPAHTLVKANAAAIKLDGLEEYGRILWGTIGVATASVYSPSAGVLEFQATTAVQTASGVPFSAGSYVNTSTGFRVGGLAGSGQYLRGDGTNFVSSAIQAADVPNLDARKITSGQFADARMPTDVVTSQDGAAHKIAAGSVLVSAGGSATVSTGLSAITGFGVEHVWTVVKFVQHAATVSGGSITIYNDGANNEYFSWIAFGTA